MHAEILKDDQSISSPELKSIGLQYDDPIFEAGRKVMSHHFNCMLYHEEGTRKGDDIEHLHDMRVASRRIRAAMRVFRPQYKKALIKNFRQQLQIAGRNLGKVRDFDVFLEKLRLDIDSQAQWDSDSFILLVRVGQQFRDTHQVHLVNYLDSEKYKLFVKQFNSFLKEPNFGVKKSLLVNRPCDIGSFVPELIARKLALIQSYDALIADASVDQLHKLRIEIKRLRYSIENFKELLGKQSEFVIDELKSLQDHLGNLNDAVVAIRIVSTILDPGQAAGVASASYINFKQDERDKLIATFPETWQRLQQPLFNDEFTKMLAG